MWDVITTDVFDEWFDSLDGINREDVLAGLILLKEKGHGLARPYADTVNGSKFTNMKELRVQSKGEPLRAFFAFDPERKAVVLCAGNKQGDKRFYKRMIKIADSEFSLHLENLKKGDKNG